MALQLPEVKTDAKLCERLVQHPHNYLSCVDLIVVKCCGVCQMSERASTVYWKYGRRFCFRCLRTSTISEKRLFHEVKISYPNRDILANLPSCRGDSFPATECDESEYKYLFKHFFLKEHVNAALQARGLHAIEVLTQELTKQRTKRKAEIATIKERRLRRKEKECKTQAQRSSDIISLVIHHPIWKFHSVETCDHDLLGYCVRHHPHITSCLISKTVQPLSQRESKSISNHMLELLHMYRHATQCDACTSNRHHFVMSCALFRALCPPPDQKK